MKDCSSKAWVRAPALDEEWNAPRKALRHETRTSEKDGTLLEKGKENAHAKVEELKSKLHPKAGAGA